MIPFLPPSSRWTCFRCSAAAFEHGHAGLARAGQRHDGHVGVADDPVADVAPEAVDDVDDAVRHAGLGQQLDEALAERGRVVRGLEDDGVAADERRHDLPGGDRDREVPRRDHADDADRHADAHVELVGELGGRRLAVEAPALAGHVVAHVDRFLDVSPGLGEHLAHLARHQLGELLLVLGDERREAEDDLAALRRGHEPPAPVRLLGRLDRAVDVLRAGARERPDRLARRRAQALERLAAGGVDPLAADEVLEGPRRRRHGASLARVNSSLGSRPRRSGTCPEPVRAGGPA